jgi:hypothetical protein
VLVGDEEGRGPRSTLWRIFTGRRTSDVYIGARPIAGDVRVSLHEHGPWRFAFTKQHAEGPGSFVPPGEDRARSKWARPPEFAQGLTRAFIIVIPSSELRVQLISDRLKKPAVWIPPPPDGSQVEIDVFFHRSRAPGTWPGERSLGTRLLYGQLLPNGEELLVVSRVVETSDEVRRKLELYKNAMTEAQRQALAASGKNGMSLRGVLFAVPGPNPPKDLAGVCAFYDIALPSPSSS